jgi:thioredoxin reductase (NADPH)
MSEVPVELRAEQFPDLEDEVMYPRLSAGDVRAGATKRVAGAVGDGALAVRFAHQILQA